MMLAQHMLPPGSLRGLLHMLRCPDSPARRVDAVQASAFVAVSNIGIFRTAIDHDADAARGHPKAPARMLLPTPTIQSASPPALTPAPDPGPPPMPFGTPAQDAQQGAATAQTAPRLDPRHEASPQPVSMPDETAASACPDIPVQATGAAHETSTIQQSQGKAPEPCATASVCPPLFAPLRYDAHVDARGEGLLHYQKYWFLSEVSIGVRGELLSGIPASLHDNTLRLINSKYSYYIPLRQIDYIRTDDGLDSSFEEQA